MCDKHTYTLHINDSRAGDRIPFPEFPDLDVVYLSSENNLCPSHYDASIKCVFAGELKINLRVNGQDITLSDQDKKRNNEVLVEDYSFMGEAVFILQRSPDFTYLIISVCRNTTGSRSRGSGNVPTKPARIPIVPMIKPLPLDTATLTYNAGQPFIIELEENVTTGFSWSLDLPVNITLITEASTGPRRQSGMVGGGGGVHTFVLKGSRPGKSTIRAIYKRSWEDKKVVTDSRNLKIYDVQIV